MQKKLIGAFTLLLLVFLSGITGYVYLEGWSIFDAFYMTVITLSSVGFGEVHDLSVPGRVFTTFLILCGTGVLVYGISVITAFIVEGELSDVLRRKKMDRKIEKLAGHYIVCGANQTGGYVVEELLKTKRSFVVIEKDPEKIKGLIDKNILCIQGDATHDAVLLAAGIEKSAGLITSLHTDAENLLVVVTVKRLNPSVRIISKAVEEESEQKLRMAGADGVVLPNFIGGLRMASEAVRPSVVTFLDTMLRNKDRTVRIENIEITPDSPYRGKALKDTCLYEKEGVCVVAIMIKPAGEYIINPSKTMVLNENNILIVMGDVALINELK